MSGDNSNWLTSVRKQEEEAENAEKQMLSEKMKDLQLKNIGRASSTGTSGSGGAGGWPTLPPVDGGASSKPRSGSVGDNGGGGGGFEPQKNEGGGGGGWPNISQRSAVGGGQSLSTPRPPSIGGAGRGKPFALRGSGNTQSSGGIGGFASLGAGGTTGSSFGQFGGFSSSNSASSANSGISGSGISNSANFGISGISNSAISGSSSPARMSNGSSSNNFSFKSPAAVENNNSNKSSNPNSASFGGNGGNNWPNLEQEKKTAAAVAALAAAASSSSRHSTAASTTTEWPKVDNFTSDNLQQSSNATADTTSKFGASSTSSPFVGGQQNTLNWGAGNSNNPQQQQDGGGGLGGDEDADKSIDKAEVSYLNKILHDKLVNTKYDVEIERQNPNNPLFSVKSFEELRLSDELLRGVWEMGFRYPSKIQESALPALLADPPQNMIAQSQSGTGKTAAFVLTMLSRVDPSQRYPQCLCLSPTYELALQIGKVVEEMGKYLTDVKLAYAVRGGMRLERGAKITEQIVIGTPGTVLDWALRFRFFDPKNIGVFVLDEADLMIGMQGHQDQSIRIHKLLPATCQHLLFSATYDDEVMDFAYKIITDPVVIRLRREEETLDYIKQYYVNCRTREEKYKALCTIYGTLTIGQAIIFCRTKKEASWLAGQMTEDGHSVSLLSAELTIEQRAAIFERFKRGDEKVLISTNLTARGIDVKQVNIVINYDLPTSKDGQPDFEAYLHRIGRSGRFGKPGIAINFIDNNWSRSLMDQIQAHFGKEIVPLDVEDMDALEKIESWD